VGVLSHLQFRDQSATARNWSKEEGDPRRQSFRRETPSCHGIDDEILVDTYLALNGIDGYRRLDRLCSLETISSPDCSVFKFSKTRPESLNTATLDASKQKGCVGDRIEQGYDLHDLCLVPILNKIVEQGDNNGASSSDALHLLLALKRVITDSVERYL